jgi:MFS transporter, DHA2 family, multidrug resistance protein
MAAMLVVGKLIGRIDRRLLLGIGLVLTAWSFYAMTGWTPDISQMTIVIVEVIQGVVLGFLFVPLSTVTLSTLSPELRAKASAFSACRATSAQASASRW